MNEQEAEELIKKFLEYKMMWHKEDGFVDSYILKQAMNILGQDKVTELTLQAHKIWND